MVDVKGHNRNVQSVGGVHVGDVFYDSWGYDQTNYDYIVVVGFTDSGKYALCKLAKAKCVGTTAQQNIQMPLPEGYGQPFKMKIRDKDWNGNPVKPGEETLRGTYPIIYQDGTQQPFRLASFSKANPGETFYETDSMFGH